MKVNREDDFIFLFSRQWDGVWGSAGLEERGIQLRDYSKSLDLQCFPKNTLFNYNVIQKQEHSNTILQFLSPGPESVHTLDLYGLCEIVHYLLFGKQLELTLVSQRWKPKQPFKRYWDQKLWEALFDFCLNSNNTSMEETNRKISELRIRFEHYFLRDSFASKSLKRYLDKQENEVFPLKK
jgi:checkpoint serine/threonine-protein kinase